MGCPEANARLKARAMPVIKGESRHPAHAANPSGMSTNMDAAASMVKRFYGKKSP